MNKFDSELVVVVTRGCRWVWNEIADDVGYLESDGSESAETEIEMCLDADRLYTFGYHKEHAALKLLLEQGAFSELCKTIAKNW